MLVPDSIHFCLALVPNKTRIVIYKTELWRVPTFMCTCRHVLSYTAIYSHVYIKIEIVVVVVVEEMRGGVYVCVLIMG